jgi:hypothetical protein
VTRFEFWERERERERGKRRIDRIVDV